MSNRLTFSLASLFLIFALLVAPTAVMAEKDGPTITSIVLDPDTDQARTALVFKITFSEDILASTFADGDIEWNVKDAGGAFVVTPPSTTITDITTQPTSGATSSDMFTFSVNVSGVAGVGTARTIVIQMPVDKVNAVGGTGGEGKKSQVSTLYNFNLPPAIDDTAEIMVEQQMKDGSAVADKYTLTLTFKDSDDETVTAAPNPAPQIRDIMVNAMYATPIDEDGDEIDDLSMELPLKTADAEGIYTQDYEIDTDSLDSMEVEFQMHPGYIMSEKFSLGMPEPPTKPSFDDKEIKPIVLWVGQKYNMDVDSRVYLPLARGGLNDTLKYSVMPELPDGLEASEIDAQHRFITGSVDTAQKEKTFKWIATNSVGGTDSIEFTITVKDPVKPGAPTAVMADEKKRGAIVGDDPDANKVTVSWKAPSKDPTMDYGAEIDNYVVYWTDIATDAEEMMSVDDEMYMVDETTGVISYTTAKLEVGKYEFEVAAENSAGVGKKSAPEVLVTVANPPSVPTNLEASKNADASIITLSWKLPSTDGGADITAHKVYITLPDLEAETEMADADDMHRITTELGPGRHVFRVTAVNIEGESIKSDDTFLELVVPSATTNQGPTFGDAKITAIRATQGVAITGVTLPAAKDPDGDDSAIDYELDEDLPEGLEFNDETRFLSGTPTESMSKATYTYTATDSGGKDASLSFELEVMAEAETPVSDDLDATYATGTGAIVGVTTIGGGTEAGTMIDPNGFATIGSEDLPDLEKFLATGGTIGLSNGDATDDKNARSVVISEILWGLDFGAPAMEQTQWQFIELYNTTTGIMDLNGWTLTFTTGAPAPDSDIDRFSNRKGAGWNIDPAVHGQSGRVTGTRATDPNIAITAVNIVSMYRDINYKDVRTKEKRADQLNATKDGTASGSWKASQRRSTYNQWIYDSKRAEHFKSTPLLTASVVADTPFRINEIGNDTGSENDWVELHNHTDSAASLKNYSLSMVTKGADNKLTDAKLFDFKDQDWSIDAKGFVVISTRHPRDTDLAAGKDLKIGLDAANEDNQENKGASHIYVVKTVNLDDGGAFALILRKSHDGQGGGGNLVDVVATRKGAFPDIAKSSSLWPLTLGGQPHENVIDVDGGDELFRAGRVYKRNGGNGRGEKQFTVDAFTGIGYDRAAAVDAANGGTPGYENNTGKGKIAELSAATVTFSEIMLSVGESRTNLPQWIELYNSSMMQSVNLNGWKLHVENYSDIETALDAVLTLDAMVIPPNQTVLIVTNSGRVSDPDHFPTHRVANLWTTKKHRDALEMIRRTDQVFSTMGINLQLYDADNKLVDEAGNLDGNRRTRDELENTWAIPMNGDDDERRSSLVRVYDPTTGALDGDTAEAWVLADTTNLAFAISQTYYGDPDDFGTPGFRGGGPLPVRLSKFRPERLDDGSIRIVWATESELNNAGFNILRSEKRDGEFKQINTKLIAGKGTTSERSTYTHVDSSAKPNVVYYYQIQDVSLDGKVTTLRETRLKGHISAAGKLTTTWGDIKALQ